MDNHGQHGNEKNKLHHHHILPNKIIVTIGVILLILTVVTVWAAGIDMGPLNTVVAIFIATVKASLVALFFMGLKYDRRENGVVFVTSFLFLGIFITLTGTDLFFRGNVYVQPGEQLIQTVNAKSTLKTPWISTPEMVAKGKELFNANGCTTCHGVEGLGNGVASAGLNPPPRNFHQDAGWKNGRKMTMVFKTLKEGLPPSAMASYAALPIDDRWDLAAYVLSLGPTPPKENTAEDFKLVGIDPTKPGGGLGAAPEAPTIPVDVAMERMEQPEPELKSHTLILIQPGSQGAQIYQAQCISCHGVNGEGGIRVKNMGGFPKAYATTMALTSKSGSIQSSDTFNRIVVNGLQGDLMPSHGELSQGELRELYSYVKSIASVR